MSTLFSLSPPDRYPETGPTVGGQPPPRRLAIMLTADVVEALPDDRLALVSADRRRRVFGGKTPEEVADAVRDHVYKRLLGPVVIESATPPKPEPKKLMAWADRGGAILTGDGKSAPSSEPKSWVHVPGYTVSDDGKSVSIAPLSGGSPPECAGDDFDDAGFGKSLPPIPLAAELDRLADEGAIDHRALNSLVEESRRVALRETGWLRTKNDWPTMEDEFAALKAEKEEVLRKAELARMVNAEPDEATRETIFRAFATPKVPASQLKEGFLTKDLPTAIEAARGHIGEQAFRRMYLQEFPSAARREVRIEGRPRALMDRRGDLAKVGVTSMLYNDSEYRRISVVLFSPEGGRVMTMSNGDHVFFDAAGHRVAVICHGGAFVGVVGMDNGGVIANLTASMGVDPAADRLDTSVASVRADVEHVDCSPGAPHLARGASVGECYGNDKPRVKVAIGHLPEVLLNKLDDLKALGIAVDVYHLAGAVTLTLPPGWASAGGEGTTFTLSDADGHERVFIRVGEADKDDHVSIYEPMAPLF